MKWGWTCNPITTINDSPLGHSYIKQIEAPFKCAEAALTHTLAHPSYCGTLPYIVATIVGWKGAHNNKGKSSWQKG